MATKGSEIPTTRLAAISVQSGIAAAPGDRLRRGFEIEHASIFAKQVTGLLVQKERFTKAGAAREVRKAAGDLEMVPDAA